MKQFFLKCVQFIKEVSQDSRIPERDKTILASLIVLVISPIDLIPDWIPIFGQLDDIVIMAIILDYLFSVLDSEILLTHYPWDMKSFARLRRFARIASSLVPSVLKKRIWSYKKIPY
jgi:uncharacterized membrane protein YkvA (DUF1232 family)